MSGSWASGIAKTRLTWLIKTRVIIILPGISTVCFPLKIRQLVYIPPAVLLQTFISCKTLEIGKHFEDYLVAKPG